MNKNRLSNFELLRIIAMLGIIIHHSTVHGLLKNIDFVQYFIHNSDKFVAQQFFVMVGKIGVLLFVLITGYFSINSKFKIQKIFSLILTTLFYSILCTLLAILIDPTIKIDLQLILHTIFPISFEQYWFINYFLLLYLAMPILNLFWKSISLSIKKIILIIFLIIQCVPSTISGFFPIFNSFNYGLNGDFLTTFILAYLLGAYFKEQQSFESIRTLSISFISILITFGLFAIISTFTIKNQNATSITSFTFLNWNIDNIFCFVFSILIFSLFANIKIPNISWINFLSKSAFSVYLIHDNPLIRSILWSKFNDFSIIREYSFLHYLIYTLLLTVIIYTVCTFIDNITFKPTKYLTSKLIATQYK